jgi:4-alpha-glucanotransferase
VHQWGGQFVGTLPLLASPLDKKDAIYSPYSPVSKLFWNELFLDIPAILSEEFFADFAHRGEKLRQAIAKLNETDLIGYQAVYDLKKRLLLELALHFFKNPVPQEYLDYVNTHPLLEEYAHFRAQGNPEERKYHLFVQFQMHKQLGAIKKLVDQNKAAGLYLDFPVGTNPDGFDNQFFKSIFLTGCSVGAPPDLLFKDGQNWGFSPPNALPMRERHYDYFRHCLRHHMQFAKILRMDHVMALKRLYIIPPGKAADKGIYLRYNADELFTILAIEAHRHGVQVIGENLGTVPMAVQEAMAQHEIYGMWVLAFEAGRSPTRAIHKVAPRNLMCLNTHDMSPFAGYLAAQDLKSFIDIGILSEEDARAEIRKRKLLLSLWKKDLHEDEFSGFFAKVTSLLAQSDGDMLLVNVEDLWAETEAQNIPGTLKEHPNWRRRLKYSLEEWTENPDFAAFMQDITTLRKKGSHHVSTDLRRSVSL